MSPSCAQCRPVPGLGTGWRSWENLAGQDEVALLGVSDRCGSNPIHSKPFRSKNANNKFNPKHDNIQQDTKRRKINQPTKLILRLLTLSGPILLSVSPANSPKLPAAALNRFPPEEERGENDDGPGENELNRSLLFILSVSAFFDNSKLGRLDSSSVGL